MFEVVSSDGTVIACEGHGDAGPTLVLVGGTWMTRAPHAPHAPLASLPVLLFGMSSGAVLALEAVARGSAALALALYEPPFVVGGAARRCPPTTSTA
ncbi:hypothetical protein [Streptomyces sp. NRRL F-2580]|uniref:hypothetical protein n=1 Tax=Streptomyces sp. NRRL F-2580 TaxID=1463841 RepID=UPI00069057D3|nr:hypothetical protein [Streptomyces sp. NRRL F-2580]